MPAGEVRQLGPGRIITAPGLYADCKTLIGQHRVIERRRIGRCVMKPGDILTVFDFGSSMVGHIVRFRNSRLPLDTFTAAAWAFPRFTEPARLALQRNPTDLAAALTLSDSAQL